MSGRWTVNVSGTAADSSEHPLLDRQCTTGDNAKDWGRYLTRGICSSFREYPKFKVRIFAPDMTLWAVAEIDCGVLGRMKWRRP